MAIFFPALDKIDNNTPQSERVVLHSLAKALADDFIIYHSLSFIEKKTSIKEGEADLVIFHRQSGLLILEVKGGEISIDNGQWFSENRLGKHAIKNPFDQARKAKHALMDKIKKKHKAYVAIGYGVCFPHSTLPVSVSLPMDVTRELVIDSTLLFQPDKCASAIEKLFASWNTELSKTSADFIQHHILAPSFRLIPNPKLSISEIEEKFLQLTQDQYRLLDWLEEQKQVLIHGSAGTGKTLLLLEKARRLSEQGKSVLILSFNIKLSAFLKAVTAQHPLIHANYFHGFCKFAAEKLKTPFSPPPDNDEARVFYEETAPEIFLSAIDSGVIPLFDAVLIDEGQDFSDDWWIPIASAVKPDGWFYIFYDAQQNVFARQQNFPITSPPYPLKENCRNTQSICQWLSKVNASAALAKNGSPMGEQPAIHLWLTYEEQLEQVRVCLSDLLAHGYLLSDIVVLTPYRIEKSLLHTLKREKLFTHLTLETIMKYKGLEAPIVLVCDLGMNEFAKRPDMLFTGASRAQQMLFVFCHKHYPLLNN